MVVSVQLKHSVTVRTGFLTTKATAEGLWLEHVLESLQAFLSEEQLEGVRLHGRICRILQEISLYSIYGLLQCWDLLKSQQDYSIQLCPLVMHAAAAMEGMGWGQAFLEISNLWKHLWLSGRHCGSDISSFRMAQGRVSDI